RWDRRRDRGGNSPPHKALKTHKMGKESRFCARRSHRPVERPAPRRKARRAFSARLSVGGDPEPIVDFLNRGASIAGSRRERLTANGVARKWQPQRLERLNQRPEMGWLRRRRTHKIWYRGARLTVYKNDEVGRKLSALRNLENSESRPRAKFPGGRNCSRAR